MGTRILSALAAASFVTLAVTSCGGSSAASTEKRAVKLTSTVLYEVVGGQKGASVTMETPTGTSQLDVSIPMKKKNTTEKGVTYSFEPGDFVYISAQGKGGSNNVICRITVDGTVISENKATGYGIATCKGNA